VQKKKQFESNRKYRPKDTIRYNLAIKQFKGKFKPATTVRIVSTRDRTILNYHVDEALKKAKDMGLDLVEIIPPNENQDFSLCRIMKIEDYFEENDRLKTTRDEKLEARNQGQKVKELRFNFNIAEHDVQTKVRRLLEFLKDKYRIKVTIHYPTFRSFDKDTAIAMMQNIYSRVEDIAARDDLKTTGLDLFTYFYLGPKQPDKPWELKLSKAQVLEIMEDTERERLADILEENPNLKRFEAITQARDKEDETEIEKEARLLVEQEEEEKFKKLEEEERNKQQETAQNEEDVKFAISTTTSSYEVEDKKSKHFK